MPALAPRDPAAPVRAHRHKRLPNGPRPLAHQLPPTDDPRPLAALAPSSRRGPALRPQDRPETVTGAFELAQLAARAERGQTEPSPDRPRRERGADQRRRAGA